MTVQTTDGKTLTGRVLGEGMTESSALPPMMGVWQLFAQDCRHESNTAFVTSQRDWPTYHGDMSGNHYTTVRANQ